MKLVLDTNSLFTLFWNGSLIKKLLISEHDLYSPDFALKELNKHKEEILKKAKISSIEFDKILIGLQDIIKFIKFENYSSNIPEAFNLLPDHPKDIDFLALALKINAGLLSNDKELNKQIKIKIFSREKYAELF